MKGNLFCNPHVRNIDFFLRHKIKNHESQVAIACQGITASMRLILSGTPLQNNLVEREDSSFGFTFLVN